ncbi:transcription termination factor MTERF9, chloroplastic-like [Salvia miltiorrhiza]|uniref:transcription termination factor MTERF9, chloroplastic-like n=1 Tax=Salvia miltiorrhiza TaxID=226208 RepID=UPI0025AD39E4|nr:transcription termination factor MTERF9, chloroplastic-like [Salvia miltiorrhiza]
MFAIICRRGVIRVPGKDSISVALRFLAHFSWVNSYSTSDGGGGDAGGQSLTISYLVGACGLPEKAAVSASKSLCIKSRENPAAVLELLKDYGFTDSQISRIVSRWPRVLQCSPDKTLMPKLEFFRSIGVPDCIAAQRLSVFPRILQRSLRNHLIPSYNYLKVWVRSEERVAIVFKRAPLAFSSGWSPC